MAKRTTTQIAMIGLGPMGENLALNMISKGIDVKGYAPSETTRARAQKNGVPVTNSISAFPKWFKGTRTYWIMVPDSKVDDVLEELAPHMRSGDIIVEGGNSHFRDTDRRCAWARKRKFLFIGTGVSGGEEGARLGPCIMPGGDKNAYDHISDVLTLISARANGKPCVAYIGPGGAGHFVKMVHNGIEYALMQAISESYHLLSSGLKMTPAELKKTYTAWSKKPSLGGYLLEITADIVGQKDKRTGKNIVDVIKDTAGQKGTGKWTSQTAYDLGVPVHSISAALLARIISAHKSERVQGSALLSYNAVRAPKISAVDIEEALLSSFIIAYAQGFALLAAGSREHSYNLKLEEIARIWRGGCIIRAPILDTISAAYTRQPALANMLFDKQFSSALAKSTHGLRSTISYAAAAGIPVPVMGQTLAYYDALRTARLPGAALIQAQRDYFGAHTYERTDGQGVFHTLWSGDRSEVKKG